MYHIDAACSHLHWSTLTTCPPPPPSFFYLWLWATATMYFVLVFWLASALAILSLHKTCRIFRSVFRGQIWISNFFFFRWRYRLLWALACRTIPLHFSLSITKSLHLFTPSTWRSLSTYSLYPFLGLPLRLVLSSFWVKIFLGILFSSILSRWPSQLFLCPFVHFTIFSPLLNSSSSRFVLLFNSPSSHLGPYIFLKYFSISI
jgi:hypothetical protein